MNQVKASHAFPKGSIDLSGTVCYYQASIKSDRFNQSTIDGEISLFFFWSQEQSFQVSPLVMAYANQLKHLADEVPELGLFVKYPGQSAGHQCWDIH